MWFSFKRKSRRYYPTRLAINLASAGIGKLHSTFCPHFFFIKAACISFWYVAGHKLLRLPAVSVLVTYTQDFRPFIPSILEEWETWKYTSPYNYFSQTKQDLSSSLHSEDCMLTSRLYAACDSLTSNTWQQANSRQGNRFPSEVPS